MFIVVGIGGYFDGDYSCLLSIESLRVDKKNMVFITYSNNQRYNIINKKLFFQKLVY